MISANGVTLRVGKKALFEDVNIKFTEGNCYGLIGANVLMLDEPTDHLDMESITALNNGLIKFPGVIIFSSRDHQIVETTANRIMEIVNGQLIDKITTYDEYLASDEMARKRQIFTVAESDEEEELD